VLIENKVEGLSFTLTAALVFALPSLYFIYLNCPISILLNHNAWKKEVSGFEKHGSVNARHFSSNNSFLKSTNSRSSTNYSSDNTYRHMSSNSHYHR
jgi:hypothetical protein